MERTIRNHYKRLIDAFNDNKYSAHKRSYHQRRLAIERDNILEDIMRGDKKVKMLELWNKGMNKDEIAKEIGTTEYYVRWKLNQMGVSTKRGCKYIDVADYYKTHGTYETCLHFNISKDNVYSLIGYARRKGYIE